MALVADAELQESVARDGRTAIGAAWCTRGSPAAALARALPAAVRHGRAELDLLPAADAGGGERWAAAARPGFLYAVKLGAFGSHRKKLRDAASWLPNHLDRACRLGEHLGPTLVQLPPRWKRNVARLDEFLELAPRRCDGRSSCAIRRGCTTTCSRCCAATAPRSASTTCCRPSLRAHHRLDVRPVPRPGRDQSSVPRLLRRGPTDVVGRQAGNLCSMAARCLRLLQQRLAR